MDVNSTVTLLTLLALMGIGAVEVPKLQLNDGRQIPAIALGTYLGIDQIFNTGQSENTMLRDLIANAIEQGYRQFDTAAIYETEAGIARAVRDKIADGAVRREDIFITTKLWNTRHQREQVTVAIREALTKMGLEYVDLYLMHWPMGLNDDQSYSDVDYMETWRGLEDVQRLGLARSIGVSNFNEEQLQRLIGECSIKPAVLQIEVHPQNIQTELVTYAQGEGLVVMGYSPFGSLVARHGMWHPGPKLDDPVLAAIARKHGKTVPQVVLRWLIDRNIVPIAKTVKVKRLKENIDVFDFRLDQEDHELINKFDTHTRYTLPSFWQTHPYYPFERVENAMPDPWHNHKSNRCDP